MPKFFVLPEKAVNGKCIIDTEDVAHITRVLRLGIGDSVTVCDSAGMDYTAEISSIEPGKIVCDIISSKKSDTEPDIELTLYQGIPKGPKMEYIIQRTTELGITRIVPCTMARCVSRLDGEKAERKKVERWQKIAESAAKQSGRGIIPEVCMPVSFKDAVRRMTMADAAFAPYECESTAGIREYLKSLPEKVKTAAFIIGPEGGFDPAEVEILKENGIKTVSLGKRILRTETAGGAVTAVVMYESGNM